MKFALLILIAIGIGLILYAPQEYRLTVAMDQPLQELMIQGRHAALLFGAGARYL